MEDSKKTIELSNSSFTSLILILACIIGIFLAAPFFGKALINSCDYITHYGIEKVAIDNIKSGRGIFTVFPQMGGIPFFSVYQPLFHWIGVAFYFLFFCQIPVAIIHNFLVGVSLVFFPLSIYYCLRKFEFPPLLCSIAALFSLAPISGWGHTFNTYLDTGVVTQSLGVFIFPFAVGYFYQYVKNKKGNIAISIILLASISLMSPIFLVPISFIIGLFCILFSLKLSFKKIIKSVSIFIILLLLISFWLVPMWYYQITQAPVSDWYHLPTSHEVSFTVTSFYKVFIGGELLDKVHTDSLLTKGGYHRQNFRWPRNSKSSRAPFLTIFTLLGILISILKIEKFKYSFFSLGWVGSIFLLLGGDDIKLLSHFPWYPPLRMLVLFEFFSICLAGIGLFFLIRWIFSLKPNFFKSSFIKIILILLILGIVFVNVYVERYNTTRNMVHYLPEKEVEEIISLFSWVRDNGMKGRFWISGRGDQWQKVRALFPLQKTPILYTDFFRGYFPQKLIEINRKDIPRSIRLTNLYNVFFVVSKKGKVNRKGYLYRIKKLNYQLVNSTKNYFLFRTPTSHKYIQFLKNRPILTLISERNWGRLARIWSKQYAEGKIGSVFLIRANSQYISEVKKDKLGRFPVIFLFDYKVKNRKKSKKILKSYIKKGGIIVSFDSVFDLPVKMITKDNNDFSHIINSLYNLKHKEFNNEKSGAIQVIENKSNRLIAKIKTNTPRFLLFKMNYYPNWKIFINGKKVIQKYESVPSFVTFSVPKGEHIVELRWEKINLQIIFSYISLLALLGILFLGVWDRKGGFSFTNKTIKNYRIKQLLIFLPLLILIFSFICLGYSYYKEKILHIPVTIYPPNNSQNYPVETRFYWNKIPYSDLKYDLQVAPTADFSNPLLFYRKREKRYIITSRLEKDKKYFWRVRSRDGNRVYKWSKPIPFYTMEYSLPSK